MVFFEINISNQAIGKDIVIFNIDESKIDTINAQQLSCQSRSTLKDQNKVIAQQMRTLKHS